MIPATRSIFDEKLENFELLAGTNCGNRLLSLMFAKTFYMEQAIEKPWFRGWVHPTWIPWMCMMCIPVPDWFMNMWITSNNPNKHGDEDSSININMTGLKKKWFDWKEATPSQPIWIIIPKKITMLVVDPIFRHQIPTLLIIYIYISLYVHCIPINHFIYHKSLHNWVTIYLNKSYM
jgi:hypothetical protein